MLFERLERGTQPSLQPHVILIDLLPGEDSTVIIGTLKAENPGVHILVLTGLVEDRQIWPALLAGASGCISMSDPPQALLQAIRASQRGETVLAAPLVSESLFELDPPALVGDLVPVI